MPINNEASSPFDEMVGRSNQVIESLGAPVEPDRMAEVDWQSGGVDYKLRRVPVGGPDASGLDEHRLFVTPQGNLGAMNAMTFVSGNPDSLRLAASALSGLHRVTDKQRRSVTTAVLRDLSTAPMTINPEDV